MIVPFLVVTKKIAHERLTALVFRDECIVTACQVCLLLFNTKDNLKEQSYLISVDIFNLKDGYVCTWARPGRGAGNVGDCE